MTKTIIGKLLAGALTGALVVTGALTLGGATRPAPRKPAAPAPAPRTANWDLAIATTPEGGYRRGNPQAPVKLVEFISYTCPHCAHFDAEASDALRLGLVRTGQGSVEVRSFLRNIFDLNATLIAQCGPAAKFHGNHAALLRAQAQWLQIASRPTQAQTVRWSNPDFATRMRAIAQDLGFYQIMLARGYDRPQLDRCLANKALGDRLARQTQTDAAHHDIHATPSFVINGQLQADTHDWATLRPKLEALTR